MTLTATDLFCGAGGSSLGAAGAGVELRMAANHWQTAIDVHQAHFPDAGHDCADISQADPRRYPRTDILLASPECTNHSKARGVSRRRQDPSLWDAPDPSAERSRATMWDVPRFAEQMLYDVIVVENVVEAAKWVGWRAWHVAMEDLGYDHRVISTNSMHHGVPQSRDRIFVVFWRKGLWLNLDLETASWCTECTAVVVARQGWKNGRTIGRYRQQWVWVCTACAREVHPPARGAREIIDWGLPCPRIGDRARPLAAKTRARIAAGIERYWAPFTTAGAGNTHERTPGNRARSVTEPLATMQTTATQALAVPLVVTNDHANRSRTIDEPAPTATTGNRHALLVAPHHGGRRDPRTVDQPHQTVTASDDRMALVVPLRSNGEASPTGSPVPTVTAGGNHHGLLMRNNGGGAEMITPVTEPARTITTKGHQSLLMPYYGTAVARPTDDPSPTVTTKDRCALVDLEQLVDDCGFRMLEPHEIAAAMAFPDGYIPDDLPKKDRVRLAGNAVTPPVMEWIAGRVREALEVAS